MSCALIVEDSAFQRKVLSKVICEQCPDIKIIEANNGEEGLEILKKESVDIVVTDLSMPGMNGLEFTKQVRKSGLEIPIVAYTVDKQNSTHQVAREAGVTEIVTKPKDDEVGRTIKKLISS